MHVQREDEVSGTDGEEMSMLNEAAHRGKNKMA